MLKAPFLSRLAEAAAALRPSPRREHGSTYPRQATARAARDQIVSRRRFEGVLSRREARGAPHCVLHVGADGLGDLNASHGYDAGDAALEVIVRELCATEGLVALCRVAGDEYALCLDVPAPEGERIAAALLDRLGADDLRLPVTVSVGLAASPRDGAGPVLMRNAAAAMRIAKHQGGAALAVFDRETQSRHQAELAMARELRHAIARNQLRLVYQPKIDALTLQVTAVEALLRWEHPTLGNVSPADFIPLAERFGLIEAIGDWVAEQALAQAAQWREDGLLMRVAINVSARQMLSEAFAGRLESKLAQHALPPSRFTCEITESAASEDSALVHRAFTRLQQVGVRVSVDDFGTGYSSLSSLRRLPVRELKLDRSFVKEIADSPEALALVNAVVQMARALDLRVVAEGIETNQQRDLLVSAGCDELQGYLFAKPMNPRAIAIWACDHRFAAAPAFKPSLFGDPLLSAQPQGTASA
jgi:EAL domain-containing protein (putative c-di-GMP-specific phosphodiesterase class I)